MKSALFKNLFSSLGGNTIPVSKAVTSRDLIAPSSVKIQKDHVEIEKQQLKTFFVFSYPRYLSVGWLSPIINLTSPLDLTFFLHPVETTSILKKLRKKSAEVQAEMIDREGKALFVIPD